MSSSLCLSSNCLSKTASQQQFDKLSIKKKPMSCADYQRMGYTQSGFYLISNGDTQIQTVYCDYSKTSKAAGYDNEDLNNHFIDRVGDT